jgi:CheY-like chemotaxis protein
MTLPLGNTGLKILLVEDDKDDVMFFTEAIKKLGAYASIIVVGNGEELFDQMEQSHDFDVIFLDINLPLLDGKQCLKKLKANEFYKDIPVIMFTGSSAQTDVDESYEFGAHFHLVKPYAQINYVESLKIVLAQDWKVKQPRPSKEKFLVNFTFN